LLKKSLNEEGGENMNPRQFLLLGGIVLVALSVLGVTVLGPTALESYFGVLFYLTNGENVAHLVFGVVALLAYYFLKDEQLTKWLVIVVGVVALFAALYGFMVSGDTGGANFFGVANVENPLDNVLHLVVAAWAFYAAFMGGKKPVVASPAQ
jgi:hypothetical protein